MKTSDMQHLTGKKIKLISMGEDPDPITPGATGKIHSVVQFRNSWHLNMIWDEEVERSLNLIIPPDRIEVIDG